MKFSVVVIAHNEEDVLADCLTSVGFASEVIVVNDMSSDNTVKIAEQHGAKVYDRKLDGFASQKNFGIEKTANQWVLILDADERVSAELSKVIQALEPPSEVSAYSIAFRNFVGGSWLRHGGLYPDRHIRLFDKTKARYGKREVHETLEISEGRTAELAGDIVHLTYAGRREYLDKVRTYSRRQAEEDLRLGQPTRYLPFLTPVKVFLFHYVKLVGFLDGWNGFISALYLAYYRVLYQRRLKELRA